MSSHRAGPAHFVSLTLAVPVLLLAAAHPTAAVADALPPQIYTPDSQGLATSDGFTAVLHNPAGIGIRGTGVYLGATQMESRWSTASVFGQAGALAIGYQHWSGDFFGVNRDQYVVGHAIRLSRAARIGFSCSGWRAGAGPVRAATSWGAGLLIRPVGWLSLAAKIDDINRPRFGDGLIPRIYRAGVALRPRTTRLTLTFDAASDVFDDWADAEFRWGAQIEPVDGLLLGASVDREGTFHVGLGINGRRTGAGALVSRTEAPTGAHPASSPQSERPWTMSPSRGSESTSGDSPIWPSPRRSATRCCWLGSGVRRSLSTWPAAGVSRTTWSPPRRTRSSCPRPHGWGPSAS
jgi:hypothetical protein